MAMVNLVTIAEVYPRLSYFDSKLPMASRKLDSREVETKIKIIAI